MAVLGLFHGAADSLHDCLHVMYGVKRSCEARRLDRFDFLGRVVLGSCRFHHRSNGVVPICLVSLHTVRICEGLQVPVSVGFMLGRLTLGLLRDRPVLSLDLLVRLRISDCSEVALRA